MVYPLVYNLLCPVRISLDLGKQVTVDTRGQVTAISLEQSYLILFIFIIPVRNKYHRFLLNIVIHYVYPSSLIVLFMLKPLFESYLVAIPKFERDKLFLPNTPIYFGLKLNED